MVILGVPFSKTICPTLPYIATNVKYRGWSIHLHTVSLYHSLHTVKTCILIRKMSSLHFDTKHAIIVVHEPRHRRFER